MLCVVFIGISIPLIQKRVPPNRWYGFRTSKTLRSAEIWYPANAYGAKLLLAASLFNLLPVLVFAFLPGITPEMYNCIVTLFMTVTLFVSLVMSLRFIQKL